MHGFICKTSYTFSSSLKVSSHLAASSLKTLPLTVLSEVDSFLSHALLFFTCAQAAEGGSLTACPWKFRFLTSRGSPLLPGKGFCFPPCASFPFLLDGFLNTLSSLGPWTSPSQLMAPETLSPGSPDLGHSHGRFPCGSFVLSSGLCSDIPASISAAPGPDSLFLLYSSPLHL